MQIHRRGPSSSQFGICGEKTCNGKNTSPNNSSSPGQFISTIVFFFFFSSSSSTSYCFMYFMSLELSYFLRYSGGFIRQPVFIKVINLSLQFTEQENVIVYSQHPATSSNNHPHQPSPQTFHCFLKIHFNIIISIMSRFPKWSPFLSFTR